MLPFQPLIALCLFSCTDTLTDALTAVLDLVLLCAWNLRVQKNIVQECVQSVCEADLQV